MIVVYGESSDQPRWKPGDELPCGCRFTSPQLVNMFGSSISGDRGFTCVHQCHYVASSHVEHILTFEIKKGIQP